MALDQILSVSGKSGLFRLVGQMKNGIIVEGVADKKRFPVHGTAKVSALEEISIYSNEEEIPLNEIFKKIFKKESGKVAMEGNLDKDAVKAYFETILPEYDKERVYLSDMQKVVKWYNILVENNAYSPKEVKEAADNSELKEKPSKMATKKVTKKPAAKKPSKNNPKTRHAGGAGASSPRKSGGAQRGG